MDDDGNRKLSMDEFRKGVQEYGLGFTKDEIFEMFRSFDRDENGSVDYEEFLRSLRVKIYSSLALKQMFCFVFQPPLNKFRLDLIAKAFAKLDKLIEID